MFVIVYIVICVNVLSIVSWELFDNEGIKEERFKVWFIGEIIV